MMLRLALNWMPPRIISPSSLHENRRAYSGLPSPPTSSSGRP